MADILSQEEIDALLSATDGDVDLDGWPVSIPIVPHRYTDPIPDRHLWAQVKAAKRRQADRPWWQKLQREITTRWNPYE